MGKNGKKENVLLFEKGKKKRKREGKKINDKAYPAGETGKGHRQNMRKEDRGNARRKEYTENEQKRKKEQKKGVRSRKEPDKKKRTGKWNSDRRREQKQGRKQGAVSGKKKMFPEKEFWKAGNMLYPLPAVMVSCGFGGISDIITVAWIGTVCTNPAMVSISVRPERYSYELIKNSGEFVINLTTKRLAHAMDFCGVRSGRDLDKWKEMHLTSLPGEKVAAPLIAESPVNIECKVEQCLELGSHHMFLARVEGVHVDRALLDEKGKLCLEKAEFVVYSHGIYYDLGKMVGSFGYSVKK